MTQALAMDGTAGAGIGRPPGIGIGRVAAVLVLVLALPLALVAVLLVWSDLGRPIVFRQTRSGKNDRPFTVMKFRTMRETRGFDGRLLPDRMRETPITRALRRLRLDEIPQLVAIAKGDMAFVGPRPLLPLTIAGFGELGLMRCAVRPGLTGWAQVNGNTRLADREKLALDLWYILNRTAALDLRILLLTVVVILRGERVNERALLPAMAALKALETSGTSETRS